jgi:hypothetical protein
MLSGKGCRALEILAAEQPMRRSERESGEPGDQDRDRAVMVDPFAAVRPQSHSRDRTRVSGRQAGVQGDEVGLGQAIVQEKVGHRQRPDRRGQ